MQMVCHMSLEKTFDEGYNFALDLTSIEGLHTNLWAFKVTNLPISKILRL
jgi:hypothetical protein